MTSYRSAYANPTADTLLTGCSSAVAFASLCLVFITLSPFPSLDDASTIDATGQEAGTYLAIFGLTALSLLLISQRVPLSALLSGTKPVLVLVAWLVISITYSSDPGTSARRLTVTLAAYCLAASLPWLTNGIGQFANLLMLTAATVLILCYLGVMLVPHLAVHQATDAFEPQLAGDWRGVYGHKNITAMVMAVLFFFGWFGFRIGKRFSGLAIAIAALVFLIFSGGKAATGFIFIAAALAYLVAKARSTAVRAIIVFMPLILIATLTIGSVVSDNIHAVVEKLPIDPTFSDRADTWKFAVNAASNALWTGRGFEAFWRSADLEYSAQFGTSWVTMAQTSHNGFLDLALTTGLPGFALVVLVFSILPLRDYGATLDTFANRELSYLFLKIWLLLLYQSMFEAFLLSRVEPTWFSLALATCGLRYSARFVVRV